MFGMESRFSAAHGWANNRSRLIVILLMFVLSQAEAGVISDGRAAMIACPGMALESKVFSTQKERPSDEASRAPAKVAVSGGFKAWTTTVCPQALWTTALALCRLQGGKAFPGDCSLLP